MDDFFVSCLRTKLSSIEPLLAKHNIRLIGIGQEFKGSEEFLAKSNFKGEFFIDKVRQFVILHTENHLDKFPQS